MRRLLAALLSLAAVSGCAVAPRPAAGPAGPLPETLALFAADDALEADWQVFRLWRRAEIGLAALDDRVAIRIAAEGASAGLGRWMDVDTAVCPMVEWTWRVDSLPETADLASRDAEDVAASVLFVFGDPGSLTLPRPVPTLRYAWATAAHAPETVIDSPYYSGTLRTLVVRSGPEGLGRVVTERRDLAADYARAFGASPPEPVRLFALFTDSDHGDSLVEAFYLDARAFCAEAVEAGLIL
jgi:hypothetical protein